MTGYGRGEFTRKGISVIIEIRSFNNRFLDVSVRLPKVISQYEQLVKDLVRRYIARGRVNISIILRTENDAYLGLKADIELARAYKRLLLDLQNKLDIAGQVQIDHLIAMPDLIIMEGDDERADETWSVAKKSLDLALKELVVMRNREGQELFNDFTRRIAKLDRSIKKIEKLSASRSRINKSALLERIRSLMNTAELNEDRLEQEIAIMADRMDVTEECVRFHSHNTLFLESLSSTEPPGRRLNFLLQEMNREANTIGAKANDADIAHLVVDIKEEIEKIREQAQNIE